MDTQIFLADIYAYQVWSIMTIQFNTDYNVHNLLCYFVFLHMCFIYYQGKFTESAELYKKSGQEEKVGP